jgi:two-component system OmpR family sensor kinase
LLGLGWAVEQLWRHWQPQQEPAWLNLLAVQLAQPFQQPQELWPQQLHLPYHELPPASISWLPEEQQKLEAGQLIPLFETEALYFYGLKDQALWRLGPVPMEPQSGFDWFSLLFFLLLAVAVALWLWPVARDIRFLQQQLQRFGQGQDVCLQLPSHSFIAPIADSFQQMSSQIRSLLELQREMTHAVSHELRTPIARLTFALEMATQLPQSDRLLLLQDVRELQQLAEEMLDYARLESSQLPLKKQQVDLIELIRNVQEKLAPLPGAGISLQLPGSAQLYCDGHYLERALQNLLVNAKRYAHQTISLTLVRLPEHWQITVEDDGPGIPAALRQHVLKPFHRLEQSRNRQDGGFGLGLAIVQRIMHWHQGQIEITDSASGGACITLILPISSS